MTRLKRITNKIFGNTASTTGSPDTGAEIGQFGSAKAGTYNATADVETIQALPAYEQGWIGAVIPDQQYPTLPEMTGVNKVLSYQTGYLMQEGIPEWDSGTTYYKNSIVKYATVTTTQTTTASIGASTGITSASVNKNTFVSQISVDGNYTFTYNGTSWLYNDIVTNLSIYGITYTGTPAENDTITVTLTTTTSIGDLALYKSLTDDNTGNNPTAENSIHWEVLNLGGSGSGLEICDIGMALYVDETKGLRRYLNGQIVDINTNTQAFLNRLQEITTLHPSLLCTEEAWQTAKTSSAFGQVGKFVFNYSGANIVSVRLPRVVNVQGLFDLQNLGMTVPESLPNIKGNYTTQAAGRPIDGAFKEGSTPSKNYASGLGSADVGAIGFDASLSSSTYKDNAHVQQEAIQYPYFIQIATGSETENNIINEIELNNPYGLFDFKWADHELNNISWARADNFDWKSSATYPSAYNELLAEYNNAESVEESEGTVTFKRTPKGYKIALSTQETAILNKYNTDGIAWYYILDTTNTQFKLPRTKYGFVGLRDSVGGYVPESLPNIKGNYTTQAAGRPIDGAFKEGSTPSKNYATGLGSADVGAIGFDASLSSSTYKDNAPVQQRATQMYLYFYVGETVQNANLINAGRIGEQLANKQDKLIRYPIAVSDKSLMPSWYVVYNDGWCEQGGRTASNVDAPQTVTFLKSFKDLNYNSSASISGTGSNNGNSYSIITLHKTITSMVIENYNSGTGVNNYYEWEAKGYIA